MLEVDFDFRFLVFPQCVKIADAIPLADLEIAISRRVGACAHEYAFSKYDVLWPCANGRRLRCIRIGYF